jgi:tRNA A-37 threonylcarbamoyl transferase component Bud32
VLISDLSQFTKSRFGPWSVYVFRQWQDRIDLDSFLKASEEPFALLRDDKRSYVAVFKYSNLPYVIKIPREKDSRRWIRFTTLYRIGEARRSLTSLAALAASGVPCPAPVLFMERRRRGMIVESRMFYEYVEGRPLKDDDYSLWIEAIKDLHAAGWVHRDPHTNNFLIKDSRIFLIDCSSARRYRNSFSQMYDFVLMKNNKPEIIAAQMPHLESNTAFLSAQTCNRIVKGQRKLKKYLRNFFGIKRKYL